MILQDTQPENKNMKSQFFESTHILREPQHTPGAYPKHPQTPKWKEFFHKLLVGGLGYAPGV